MGAGMLDKGTYPAVYGRLWGSLSYCPPLQAVVTNRSHTRCVAISSCICSSTEVPF
jgi:hypothetical protein